MKQIKNKILYQKLVNWQQLLWLKPENYKTNSSEDLKKLKKSLIENHFIDPFKIWFDEKSEKLWILDGHRKQRALKELKEEGVHIPALLPACFIDCKTQKQAARLVLVYDSVYGKVNREGLTDYLNLFDINYSDVQEFTNIPEIDASYLNPIGYDEKEFETIPASPQTSLSKLGDLFVIDGKHRILCGDSRKETDVNKLFDKKKCRLVFTSPPYNMGAKHYLNYTDKLKSEEYIKFNIDCASLIKSHLNGFLFWNLSYSQKTRSEFIDIFYQLKQEKGFSFVEWIVWDKTSVRPLVNSKQNLSRQAESLLVLTTEPEKDLNFIYLGTTEKKFFFNNKTKRYLSNYWRISSQNSQTDFHKAAFPVKLVLEALELMTMPDDIVTDIFLGTGTTIIAANLVNRIGYGIELDPIYVDLILLRYKKLYPKADFDCVNRKFNFKKLFND
ncbi:MAG: DNA methyltransferase [Melioribacteraceae bacterium]